MRLEIKNKVYYNEDIRMALAPTKMIPETVALWTKTTNPIFVYSASFSSNRIRVIDK